MRDDFIPEKLAVRVFDDSEWSKKERTYG